MRIIHLCSDYSNTPLYNSLSIRLSEYITSQTIYVPVRKIELLNKNSIKDSTKIKIIYSFILRKWHRILFKLKINTVYKDFISKVEVSNSDLIHAHFLFSDGALANKLKKNYGVDFIVTVRNTDINTFFKYLLHLRSTGVSILKNAKAIIVLNPKYKEILLTYVPDTFHEEVNKKIFIIPNGLGKFWIKNKYSPRPKLNESKIKILYVGGFTKNKNIESSIKSIEKLRKHGMNIELTLVGNYGDNCMRILALQKKRSGFVNIIDKVTDKNILLRLYRSADIFLMPSFFETFGLVYLEAMSQGCPVIYSKNQGIDGYFDEGIIGYSVNPHSVNSICDAILETIKNYSRLSENCVNSIELFSWEHIASDTYKVYTGIF